ncbi:MAG: VWA domain-containing protein [Trichodesmium sp. St16_bin4-tuft]|nr:VWA domain-containing protein [Trichodesmium sp. MAG_R01]MDE5067732.1 VWA domain-containing protein [Trichodesmium sp. St4_bin8_1]MDE5072777.1 VWA domain-containing protein [Trichodesmium sp. St5_bin8]MDE5077906.1 VWA domain-containing protein [Trichodesmium sp. St2_bin6]MDE5091522.1 VWA domain-containing protein [Trichodesmium sp. St18_bin3_1_1]MDE5097269.1 VWA domain-containing protein [Trichodesmium sp. St16_bin4-tuft]MDE5105401.1 VWA domain-containing protein [Trichodesmium sp. St19_bi
MSEEKLSPSQEIKYAVDLVICIDATGSMTPVIDLVKSSALSFYKDIESRMKERQKNVDQVRAKVIVFRDYWADKPEEVMVSSEFFDLKQKSDEYAAFVSSIYAKGGGDEPENGLEALAIALKSEWENGPKFAKQRHLIVFYTDASAHSLEKEPKPSHYPNDIPKNFDEITDLWLEMSDSAKRLLLFAPDATPWTMIASSWEQTIHYPSQAGEGLKEFENEEIIAAIINSI